MTAPASAPGKAQRAALVRRHLAQLYPDPPIPLHHRDPYSLLVAVLLSAQCTDERVNMVTPGLMALADNPADMARQSLDAIHNAIRSCGLAPQKSRAIWRLSQILTERHGGLVPRDMQALEQLPGVGHKTASVVMAQAFGVPSFPVDTHIHRLAQRWRLTDGRSVARTEMDLKRLFPERDWNSLHLQIIYYGRQHCQARACHGLQCPICRACNPHRKRPIKTRKA